MKVEATTVKVKTGGMLEDVPLEQFEDRSRVVSGATVKEGRGKWTVVASSASKPAVSAPAPALPVLPVNTQASIKQVSNTNVTLQVHPDSRLQILVSCIRTEQGQLVTAQDLKPGMKLRKVDETVWMLAADQTIQSKPVKTGNYQAIAALEELYPGNRLLATEIKDYLDLKYAALYWSRSGNHCRSIAAYIFQCLLLETQLTEKPMSDSLKVRESMVNYVDTALSLQHPDFEQRYASEINYIVTGIAQYISVYEGFDFTPLAETLQLAITVVRPIAQEPFFERVKVFPTTEPYNKECQHMVILGIPPYPVLITRKLAALLGNKLQTQKEVAQFIYTKQKKEPPKQDKEKSKQVKEMKEVEGVLQPVAEKVLDYCARLLGRLEELVTTAQVGPDMCSSQVAADMQRLWEVLAISGSATDSASQLAASLGRSLGAVWSQFTFKCEGCQENYRDVFTQCGHNICALCMNRLIYTAQTQGAVLSPTEEITSVRCLCGQQLSKASLRAFDKELCARILAEADLWHGLVECSQCQLKRPQGIVWQQDCTHTCCVLCANSLTVFCKVCSADMSAVPSRMSSWALQCQACNGSFMAAHLLPVLCPSLHVVCPTCMLSSAKTTLCLVPDCQRTFASGDILTLRAKCLGTCIYCQQQKPYCDLVANQCACIVCVDCAGLYVRSTGKYTACWICQTGFTQEQSNSLYERLDLSKETLCFYCSQMFCDVTLKCGDKIHSACLYQYALTQSKQIPMRRVDCGMCGVEVYADTIFQIQTREQLPELSAANPEGLDVKCPKCLSLLQVPVQVEYIYGVDCDRCKNRFCALCMEWDGDHAEGRCKVALATATIADWESRKIQCIQCPFCKCAAQRVFGQTTQKCQVCSQEFCPECAVRLDSVQQHGDGYHRAECSQYSKVLDASYKEGCSLCQILGEPGQDDTGLTGCQPPGRLARRGRFPPGFSY